MNKIKLRFFRVASAVFLIVLFVLSSRIVNACRWDSSAGDVTCVNSNSCQFAGYYCDPGDGSSGKMWYQSEAAVGCVGCTEFQYCVQIMRYCCDASEDYCAGGGSACFLPGTQISTPNGKTDIETLKVGDKVSSFNDQTGVVSDSLVSNIYSRQVADYYIVKTKSGKEIKVTGEHPLYTGSELQPAKTLPQQIANSLFLGKTYLQLGWAWARGRVR